MAKISLRTGQLRQILEIQEQSEGAVDAHGGKIRDPWLVIAKRWGKIEPLSGKELFQAQQVDSRVNHRIKIRFFDGLSSLNRIKYRKRILQISSVIDVDERQRNMIVMAIENTGTGKA